MPRPRHLKRSVASIKSMTKTTKQKTMKHSVWLLLTLVSLTTFAFAQDNNSNTVGQKFNGTWIFDAEKSDMHFGLKEIYSGQTLVISYNEPELKLIKTQTTDGETKSVTIIFYTDNRGEKNKPFPFSQNLEIVSNTLWEKDVLVRIYTDKVKSKKVDIKDKTKEVYFISADGETLTISQESKGKITTFSSNGAITTKDSGKMLWVYKRKN